MTPILNLSNLDSEDKDMDVLDSFLFQNQSKSVGGLKKRKLDSILTDSGTDLLVLKEKLERLENTVKNLAKEVKNSNKRGMDIVDSRTHQTEGTELSDQEDQFDYLQRQTKQNRDEFYKIYGIFKTERNNYTKEQLNERLIDSDFAKFKELRTLLTGWIKMGLGLSRQLELFCSPPSDQTNSQPLLTIRNLATCFGNDYTQYQSEVDGLRRAMLSKLILEANNRLAVFNTEILKAMEELKDTNARKIIIKAFKAASQAGSYLFKQKPQYSASQDTKQREELRQDTSNSVAQPLENQIYHTMDQHTDSRPLYSHVVNPDRHNIPLNRNDRGFKNSTNNWRRVGNSPYNFTNRHSEDTIPKQQRIWRPRLENRHVPSAQTLKKGPQPYLQADTRTIHGVQSPASGLPQNQCNILSGSKLPTTPSLRTQLDNSGAPRDLLDPCRPQPSLDMDATIRPQNSSQDGQPFGD